MKPRERERPLWVKSSHSPRLVTFPLVPEPDMERSSRETVRYWTAILAENITIPLLDERHNCAAARAHDRPNSCPEVLKRKVASGTS